MYKNDDIYQNILKYDFELYRGNKGITEYLSEHFSTYYNDIVISLKGNNSFLGKKFIDLLEEKIDFLGFLCKEIPEILYLYDQGLIKEAYQRSEDLFEQVKPYFLMRLSWRENDGQFYRIRKGDFRIKDKSESIKKKTQLFHITKKSRDKICAYRFSVAGYPCLYLSSDMRLAWFECGMPKKFSYCQMIIDEKGEKGLKLIDFSNRPVDFLSSINVWLLNARMKSEQEEMNIYDVFMRYIITYPLIASCSVKVKNRNNNFVEEYIFPQLLMQWIRKDKDIDGIRYKSSLDNKLVRGMGAINVAFPVKKFREDGLDQRLTAKIAISDIGFLDVNKDFCKYQKILEDIEQFKKDLYSYFLEVPYDTRYVIELIDLCDGVLKTYNALMEGNYVNSELILNNIEILYDYASLLYKNKDLKIQACIDAVIPEYKEYVDKVIMEKQFEKFHELLFKILHKHIVFEFGFENLDNFEKI
ncbi:MULTISPECIES: hypothetical protein [Clostridia]|uniref:hypothetical protein n=1 Tax=Clostridia TaxID=186801 RepID=UPI00067F55A0|nr:MULTISPECIES: hypothetical protein [Clostridia]